MPSKTVLDELKSMGEFVKSASSTVEAPVVRRLEEQKGDEWKAAAEAKAATQARPLRPRRPPRPQAGHPRPAEATSPASPAANRLPLARSRRRPRPRRVARAGTRCRVAGDHRLAIGSRTTSAPSAPGPGSTPASSPTWVPPFLGRPAVLDARRAGLTRLADAPKPAAAPRPGAPPRAPVRRRRCPGPRAHGPRTRPGNNPFSSTQGMQRLTPARRRRPGRWPRHLRHRAPARPRRPPAVPQRWRAGRPSTQPGDDAAHSPRVGGPTAVAVRGGPGGRPAVGPVPHGAGAPVRGGAPRAGAGGGGFSAPPVPPTSGRPGSGRGTSRYDAGSLRASRRPVATRPQVEAGEAPGVRADAGAADGWRPRPQG